MSNGYNVEWSELAASDFKQTTQYLSKKWGNNETRNFIRLINSNIETIRLNPRLYPSTSFRSDLRRCVVSKLHIIYYYIKEETIFIVTIWDTRRNPKVLFEIFK